MFAETGFLYPYFQNFSQEVQHLQLQEHTHSQQSYSSLSSPVSEYELGGLGDLFKAPEPIIEEPVFSFDPILDAMTAATAMISCLDDVMPTQGHKVGDLDSLQNEQLLSEFLCEPKKDLLGNISTELPIFEILDVKHPAKTNNVIQTEEKKLITESAFQKCVSSGSLSSMDRVTGNSMKPSFLDFSELDFETAYGMRRAFSEGDIKPLVVGSCTSEDRLQKLCRYRNKKSRRNFGRKIKYACRKALADSQPRIRGRFAKTEETDTLKKH